MKFFKFSRKSKKTKQTRSDSTDSGSSEQVEQDFESVYSLGRSIAHGKFGKVHKCRRKTDGMKAAVKVIETKTITKKEDIEEVEREQRLMSELEHPNCVRLIDAFRGEKDAHLVMELCEGGCLFDQIDEQGSMSEQQSASATFQLLCGLKYCHQKNIIHRDVKPENILFKDKARTKVKLADFGLSVKTEKDKPLTKAVGTLHYAAPEVIRSRTSYDHKCDVWSVGVTAYVMLAGCFPFYSKERRKIAEMIMFHNVHFDKDDWSAISEEARDFIMSCMQKNPSKRPTVQEAMKHPWLKKFARSCKSPRDRRLSR